MKVILIPKLVLLYLLLSTFNVAAQIQNIIIPEPIPTGFDFPAARQDLQKIADNRNEVAARKHAWNLWNGMFQPSKAKDINGDYLPIWETWFSQQELFPSHQYASPVSLNWLLYNRRTPVRHPQKPKQHSNNPGQVVSFNKFNPTAGAFIVAPHIGPDGLYYYNLKWSLKQLNNAWPKGTDIAQRKISEFPLSSIETKPVFMLVKRKQLTAVPYWQGPQSSINPTEPTPDTWTTCVILDPNTRRNISIRPANSKQITKADKSQTPNCKAFSYASLSQIYSYRLASSQAATAFKNEQGGSAQKGDYAVLMAMHVNTKELINWTWQTFFWSGAESPPNNFPGSMNNVPANIIAPAGNYAMCTAYWQANKTGDVKTCFNPYLETDIAGIPDGLNSNCMSCHGVARTQPRNNTNSPVPMYPKDYNAPIEIGPDSFSKHYFKGNTRTDFSWAIGSVD